MRATAIGLVVLMLAAPASAAQDFNTTTELYRVCSDTKHLDGQSACQAYLADLFRDSQAREGSTTCLRHVDNWSTRDLRNRFIYRYRVDMLSASGLKLIGDHEDDIGEYVTRAFIRTYCKRDQ